MKNVLFITSNNLATNPRLVKELTLANKNFHCTLLSFHLSNWSDPIDATLRLSFSDVEFQMLTAGRKPFLPWLFGSFIELLAQVLFPFNKKNLLLNAFAHSKRSYILWSALKKHKKRYDLVIAHNMATLYPAYLFAKENSIPFAFDIEDFHPGEKIKKDKENEKDRRTFLMQKLLPAACYISFASPLIGEATLGIVPLLQNIPHFVLNNSFSAKEFMQPITKDNSKLSFVWFSQNIASSRGLELVLPILDEFRESIEITLIGNLIPSFYGTFLSNFSEIINFKEAIPQHLLHQSLATFDVGLAIESAAADLNRELCLTNKIFAYAQAGLFVVATNTRAQALFVEQNPWCGILTDQTVNEIRKTIKTLIEQKKAIKLKAKDRFEKSKELAWEQEQDKLIKVWKSLR